MYRLNTSFVVDFSVHERWLNVIIRQYIPFLKQHGFEKIVLSRVLSIDAADHFTYSLLVDLENMDQYRLLTDELFGEYTKISEPLFQTQVTWFSSLMKIIDI